MDLEVHWAGNHPQRIGRLYQDLRGAIYFEYDESWQAGNRELSPIYLPNTTSGAVRSSTPHFGELHGLFQDALPDWWGERLMQKFFEERGIPWNRVSTLRKLACQGSRKMGALQFLPSLDEDTFADQLFLELSELVEAAREMLRGDSATVLKALMRSGMSPGGAQPKALLAISPNFDDISLDDCAPEGYGHWLVKFEMEPVLQDGRIEAAYAAMAQRAGIDIAETRLLEHDGVAHFASRRFDRDAKQQRLHLHSYSGLTHTPLRDGLEYGDLIAVARSLTQNQQAAEEIFRRAVFHVMAANDDDHGRNHAFLMDHVGTWTVAPAFDVTLASYPLASGFRAARVLGKASNISKKDLLKLATEQDIRQPREIIEQVESALAEWPRIALDFGISKSNAASVQAQHRFI
jgi:serine/threonine-protein kinase HipA